MSVESMYILHMYVSVVFLEADNNFYYNEASARYQSSGKHFDAKKNLVNQRALHIAKKRHYNLWTKTPARPRPQALTALTKTIAL